MLRPGVVIFQRARAGGEKDRQTSMRLIAQEIIPALKEHAKSIGLLDAFERTPGSVNLNGGVYARPVWIAGRSRNWG